MVDALVGWRDANANDSDNVVLYGHVHRVLEYGPATQVVIDIPHFTVAGYCAWQLPGQSIGRSMLWEMSFWSIAMSLNAASYRKAMLKHNRLRSLSHYLRIDGHRFFPGSKAGIRDLTVVSQLLYMLILRRYYCCQIHRSAPTDSLKLILQQFGRLALQGLAAVGKKSRLVIDFCRAPVELGMDPSTGIVEGFDELMMASSYKDQWQNWFRLTEVESIAGIRATETSDVISVLGFCLTMSTSFAKLMNKEEHPWALQCIRWLSSIVAFGIEGYVFFLYAKRAACRTLQVRLPLLSEDNMRGKRHNVAQLEQWIEKSRQGHGSSNTKMIVLSGQRNLDCLVNKAIVHMACLRDRTTARNAMRVSCQYDPGGYTGRSWNIGIVSCLDKPGFPTVRLLPKVTRSIATPHSSWH